ncbi:phosphate signaling complex protein PhoU [Liquorilactobacillus capillatus]|uniref:Phosphate-specific transport system accessory protein PhoU n=1 Tax=Liquorilactobacillus capillatus DSM 19910 TaxID=1423731 RepID=A0A0R1MC38_9LACO|nr:phosphate signaling complex protein PhoU [Liquorilactobacillus capillatus]KRL02674.1 phosphate transport system regulatory protein PhoU [Liquorilactobacillus capillatus DSM 19910]
MRKILEKQLKNLHEDFAKMGFDVASAIQQATNAFENNDEDLAQKVIDNDQNINEQEIYLERKAAQVMALQQPVASDLRILVTILKASSDLERIGDHAVSVARAGLRIKKEKKNKIIEEVIGDMSRHAYGMLKQIIHAYVENDEHLARDVAISDRKTDEYLKKIRKEAFRAMQNDSEFISSGTEYIVAASHIERIGDYVTNVAEWIVYTNTGRIIELG